MQINLIERFKKFFIAPSNLRIILGIWLISNLFIFLMPVSIGKSIFKNSDKIYHFLFSFVTAFIFYFSFKSWKFVLPGSLIFPVGYGFFIEILQTFLPYRDFSIFDLFFDTLGGTIFILGFFLWGKRKIKPS